MTDSITLVFQDGVELSGVAFHAAHGTFHGADDFARWAGDYAAMFPRRYAVDSVEIGGMPIRLVDLRAVYAPGDPLADPDGDDLSDMTALFAPHACACGAVISFEASACLDCDPGQYENDRLFDFYSAQKGA